MISFKFRTNEPNGLILLSSGSKPGNVSSLIASIFSSENNEARGIVPFLQSDLFAVELLNGHIYIHVDLGTGAAKVRASRRRVDDGSWHELILRRTGRECKVSVDGQWNDFRTPGDATQFELDAPIYLGGTGSFTENINWSPAVWTATLRQGYIGCLRDLALSGKPVDIAAFARQQDSGKCSPKGALATLKLIQILIYLFISLLGAVKPSCHVQSNQCGGTVPPCQNNGVCNEGWNRPICDCSATSFTGPTCGRESVTLAFNGSQHVTVYVGGTHGTRTQTEELVLRFKTTRPTGLLLLTSAESHSPDRLEISLVAGRVRASVRLGDREKVHRRHSTPIRILRKFFYTNSSSLHPRIFWPAKVY